MERNVLTPILVRAFGRSGTTFLMHILACSQKVAFRKEYPFEERELAYLFRMAQVATKGEKKSTAREDVFSSEPRYIGASPYRPSSAFLSPEDDSTKRIFLSLWRGFSESHLDEAEYIYYAEKIPHDIPMNLNEYLPCKNIFLFRDPRGEFLSIREFNRKRGYSGFGWEEGESEVDFARKFCEMRRPFMRHLASIKEDDRRIVIFYERLVDDIEYHVDLLESFLSTTIDRKKVAQGKNEFSPHMTTKSGKESISAWRENLSEEVKEIISSRLDHELRTLGYEGHD